MQHVRAETSRTSLHGVANHEVGLGEWEGLEKEWKKLCWALWKGSFIMFFCFSQQFPNWNTRSLKGQVSYKRCCDQHGTQLAVGWGSGSCVALNSLAFGHFGPHSPPLKIKGGALCPLRNFLDFLPVWGMPKRNILLKNYPAFGWGQDSGKNHCRQLSLLCLESGQ